jgi:CheY-like chemotaxis protein
MKKRVLVIEDHEDNRRIVRDLITASGYDLLEASTHFELRRQDKVVSVRRVKSA